MLSSCSFFYFFFKNQLGFFFSFLLLLIIHTDFGVVELNGDAINSLKNRQKK